SRCDEGDMSDEPENLALGQPQVPDMANRERQFLDILEHCPAGLNVVDEDGRLLFHNARIRELFGYSREELQLFDKFWSDLHHRNASSTGSAREEVSSTKQSSGKLSSARPFRWWFPTPRWRITADTSISSEPSELLGSTTSRPYGRARSSLLSTSASSGKY